jgi:tRNA(fMet)-specific endonuclease VapC
MTRLMLDTNTVSGLLKGQPNVATRLKAAAAENVCLSVVTEAELLFGVAKRPDAAKLRIAVDELLAAIDVLPWTSATARRYGILRTELERRGRPLGALDMMIAAHAAEHDMTLVTNDRAFGAVLGLRIEDWTAAQDVS